MNLHFARLDFRVGLINRCALAPVFAAETGANAHRLMSPTQIFNLDRALASSLLLEIA